MLQWVDCRNENDCGMFHNDYTYKITKNSFPLLVFGRSDVRCRFRPIAYMVSSQETAIDFQFFYTELKALLLHLKIHDSIGSSWI